MVKRVPVRVRPTLKQWDDWFAIPLAELSAISRNRTEQPRERDPREDDVSPTDLAPERTDQ